MQDFACRKKLAMAGAVANSILHAYEPMEKLLARTSTRFGCSFSPGVQIVRVMKLTLLLIVAGLLQARANGYSQQLTMDVKDESLIRVFAIIKQQTGYVYFGASELLSKAKPVTFKVRNEPLENVLRLCFKDQPLDFSIDGKTISVFEKKKEPGTISSAIGTASSSPLIDVRGRVTNEQNEAVAGVSVMVKGTKTGTYTTGEGDFMLTKVDPNAVLVFTAVNILSTEMAVNNRRLLDVKVQGKTGALDEVKVIAYGTISQRFTTGNTATVKAADIEKQPINNPLIALQGRVPGLEITQDNGIPGAGIRVRIQGRTNLTGFVASNPLIVVDGVPYPAQNLGTFQEGMGGFSILGGSPGESIPAGSTLSFLNPADIESIDVLKDADATAIYGSRAANGAILITTKKGKAGDMRVDIALEQGWGKVPVKLKLLNTVQYLEMRKEAKRNNHADILATDYDLNGLWDSTQHTDWQKEMLGGTAHFTRLSTSISGGTTRANYRIGGTYGRETTVFPGDFANTKGSLHFNINGADRNQRFQISLTGSFMLDKNEIPGRDFTEFIFLAPVAPAIRNADGSLNWAPDANGLSSWVNPLSFNENIFDIKSHNLVSNISASYKITPNLSLRANLGYNHLQSNQFLGSLDAAFKPEDRAALVRTTTTTHNTIRSWITEPQLNYSLQQFLGGRLEVLLGASFQEQISEGMAVYASGQSSDQLLRNLAAATGFSFATVNSIYRYAGFFGRINFIGKERYLFNLSARRDGSSRFGRNNLFSNFWAIGSGWIFSEESFVKKTLPWLSYGKLRGSYGLMGNDQIGDYRFMSLYTNGAVDIPYMGIRPLIGGLSNPDLQWEETRKLQLGLELGVINNRVLINLTWFRNRTGNSLDDVKMPVITGANSFTTNFPALIQNSGWELTVTTENFKTKDFTWTSTLNLTRPRNKLVAFPDLENSSSANDLVIGQPLGMTKTYSFYGIDPLTGRFLLRDAKGGLTTSPNPGTDQIVWLNQNQLLYGGLQNNLQYHNFQLSFFLQYVQQKGIDFLQTPIFAPGVFNTIYYYHNQPTAVMDRWQKPGDQNTYARFTTSSSGFTQGDRGFQNLPYLRLQNISLSYQFSNRLAQRINLKNLRAFIHAQNLFTWTNYQGLNPETKSLISAPPLRMITLGANISF
jgi:TonB-linked SusC/RagA family outer membrane protein